jgi:hypothetical protein
VISRGFGVALVVLLPLFWLTCSRTGGRREAFILAAAEARPAMELRDLYKLLYQGHFGIGHLIASREAARDYLLAEISSLAEAPDDPLLESCSPEGEMVRVNLRPFVRHGYESEKLLDVMFESLRSVEPDTIGFQQDWAAVGALIRAGALPLDPASYAGLSKKAGEQGFPAIHHSEAYSQAYHPAYRVVLRKHFLNRFPDAAGK